MNRRIAPFLVCLSAALGVTVLAGAPPQVFRSGAQTVAIYATVLDKDAHLVTDLERQHFQVLDNLKPQTLSVFKSDVQPITTVVMLDVSGSMTLNIGKLKDAAERFTLRLLPEDRARIGSFSDLIYINPPQFTNNRDVLGRVVREETRFGNPTHLWDAIEESMDALAAETGRRVVLIFTDGEDDKSKTYSYDDVITRAQRDDFMIYAIGMRSTIPALHRVTVPDHHLRDLAAVTGGGYFELRETDDLNSTFTRVADELHRQYVLGFEAMTLDGLVHKLDVQVKIPGMTVRARKSYVAKAGQVSGQAPATPPRAQ